MLYSFWLNGHFLQWETQQLNEPGCTLSAAYLIENSSIIYRPILGKRFYQSGAMKLYSHWCHQAVRARCLDSFNPFMSPKTFSFSPCSTWCPVTHESRRRDGRWRLQTNFLIMEINVIKHFHCFDCSSSESSFYYPQRLFSKSKNYLCLFFFVWCQFV